MVDPGELSEHQRSALDELLKARIARMPDMAGISVPRCLDDLALPGPAFALMAWATNRSLAAAMIGTVIENTDPSLMVVEGNRPAVSSVVVFAASSSVDRTPRPFKLLCARLPTIDRITLHVPLGDAVTATCLGHLGCTLDSYLAVRPAPTNPTSPNRGEITARLATPGDAARIAELYIRHFEDQRSTTAFIGDATPDIEVVRERVGALAGTSDCLRIAEIAGSVVGVVETSAFDVPTDGKVRRIPGGRAGVVEWVCVSPEYRGRGVGGALVGAAAEALEQSGTDYVYVFYGSNNPRSNARFWRRLGFRPTWGTWELHVRRESTDAVGR